MWCRITFWVVFVIWLLKLMQPGYLRFYDARDRFVRIYQSITSSWKPTQEVPSQEQTKIQSVSVPSSTCKPKTDYERMLATQGLFKCRDKDESKN
jgi:hypothetical protein